jgi:hypothetical protein
MARQRTVAIANHIGYDLGLQGVTITSRFLSNHIRQPDEVEWNKRKSVLDDRMKWARRNHLLGVAIGLGVFGLALYVDYAIIHEFWSRLLSNEFGEVPPSMATTVASKSLQVVFATLAIHYLVSNVGHYGRVAYSMVVFLVTAAMLLGIGLLWANNSLPEGSKVFSSEQSEGARAVDQFSKSLGVEPPKKAPVPAEVKVLKKYEVMVWLVSLSLIFLVVASIGALSLHSAQKSYSALTGGAVYDSHKEAMDGRRLHAEYASLHAEAPQGKFTKASAGTAGENQGVFAQRTDEARVNEFVSSYTAGVVDARFAAGKSQRLLEAVTHAAEEVIGTPRQSAA